MLKFLFAALFATFAALAPLHAECVGTDRFAALPADEQAAYIARAAEKPFGTGLYWEAHKGDQKVTLIGTLHLADPRFGPIMDRIIPDLVDAKTLLVEAGPEEEARLQSEMARPGGLMFSAGPTLPERLPEAEWQALSAELMARNIPPFMASKMEPWFLSVMLALSPCALRELQSGQLGLDKQVMAAAIQGGIPIRALEPFDAVFQSFANMSDEEELQALRMSMAQASLSEDMSYTTVNLYFQGQTAVIWDFVNAVSRDMAPEGMSEAELEQQMAEGEELLVINRNRAWIPVIEDAATLGPVFFAAGALHLPGENGVLNLLQDRGWTITPRDLPL